MLKLKVVKGVVLHVFLPISFKHNFAKTETNVGLFLLGPVKCSYIHNLKETTPFYQNEYHAKCMHFAKMQFLSNCYTGVSYKMLLRH